MTLGSSRPRPSAALPAAEPPVRAMALCARYGARRARLPARTAPGSPRATDAPGRAPGAFNGMPPFLPDRRHLRHGTGTLERPSGPEGSPLATLPRQVISGHREPLPCCLLSCETYDRLWLSLLKGYSLI